VGVGPHRPKGGQSPPPFGIPGFFKNSSCAGHNGRISVTAVIAAKSRRVAVPSVRVTTRAKRRAVFHLSSGGIFECGLDILKVNTT